MAGLIKCHVQNGSIWPHCTMTSYNSSLRSQAWTLSIFWRAFTKVRGPLVPMLPWYFNIQGQNLAFVLRITQNSAQDFQPKTCWSESSDLGWQRFHHRLQIILVTASLFHQAFDSVPTRVPGCELLVVGTASLKLWSRWESWLLPPRFSRCLPANILCSGMQREINERWSGICSKRMCFGPKNLLDDNFYSII